MAFEVPVATVGRRSRRSWIPAVAACLALVAGVALGTAGRDGPVRQPVGSAIRSQGATGVESSKLARPMPDRIDCQDLHRTTCLRVARAAVSALPFDAPAIRDATVWRSLLCSDNLECPQHYLDGSTPLGSVIVRFVDGGPRAAINVVEGRNGDRIRLQARAWLARWMPEDSSG
jgi:hypothetical protein